MESVRLRQIWNSNTSHVLECPRTPSNWFSQGSRVPGWGTTEGRESIQCTRPECRSQRPASAPEKNKTLWTLEADPFESCLRLREDLKTELLLLCNFPSVHWRIRLVRMLHLWYNPSLIHWRHESLMMNHPLGAKKNIGKFSVLSSLRFERKSSRGNALF